MTEDALYFSVGCDLSKVPQVGPEFMVKSLWIEALYSSGSRWRTKERRRSRYPWITEGDETKNSLVTSLAQIERTLF